MSRLDERSIEVTRIVEAPIDLVFAAFTDPAHLERWWGPEGFTARDVVSDARPGGAFSLVMEGPDGIGGPISGRYVEVDPPRRLVVETSMVGPDGSRMLTATSAVDLTDLGGKTEIRVRASGRALVPDANPALAGMEIGWIQTLRCLDDHVTGAAERQLVLMRMLPAEPGRAYEVWTTPDHVAEWFGPDGFTLTTKVMDVRPGGEWIFTMHAPDGEDFFNHATYEEAIPGERLVFRLRGGDDDTDPPFRTTVTLDGFGGGTVLTLKAVFGSPAERDASVARADLIEGGNQTLARLETYLTTG